MIKRVIIQNFQSHENSIIEFGEKTNFIIGSSDSGKSAILRAIRWVVHNSPSGDSMVSHWCFNEKKKQVGTTSVTIETDKHTITRTKSKDGNLYIVDGQEIEAFGQGVPEMVAVACNFNETNIQAQMDTPFLLADTGGEVARFFNRIVKLDKIDTYLSNIDKKKNKTRNDLATARENLEKVDKDLEKFSWLDTAGTLLAKLDKMASKKKDVEATITALSEAVSLYQEGKAYLKKTEYVARAEDLVKKIDELEAKASPLDNAISTMQDRVDAYASTRMIMEDFKHIDAADALIKKLDSAYSAKKTLTAAVTEINASVEDTVRYEQVLANLPGEIEAEQAKLPNICPTCGQSLEAL